MSDKVVHEWGEYRIREYEYYSGYYEFEKKLSDDSWRVITDHDGRYCCSCLEYPVENAIAELARLAERIKELEAELALYKPVAANDTTISGRGWACSCGRMNPETPRCLNCGKEQENDT